MKRTQINSAERERVHARRHLYGLPEDGNDAFGLALSGGGIRSATFALGVVQALARKGVLHQVDFLSTVSGGGYLGSFISSVLTTDNPNATLQTGAQSTPFTSGTSFESPPVRHMRNHSKYLAEGGMKTAAVVVATVLYGLFTSILLIAPLVLLVAIADRWLGAHRPDVDYIL